MEYRIILHDLDPDPAQHWFGLHEVFYGSPKDPSKPGIGWTKNPVSFFSDIDEGSVGILKSLERALHILRDPQSAEVVRESQYRSYRRPRRIINED